MVTYFKNRNILLQNAIQITFKETNDVSRALVQYATVNLPFHLIKCIDFSKIRRFGEKYHCRDHLWSTFSVCRSCAVRFFWSSILAQLLAMAFSLDANGADRRMTEGRDSRSGPCLRRAPPHPRGGGPARRLDPPPQGGR